MKIEVDGGQQRVLGNWNQTLWSDLPSRIESFFIAISVKPNDQFLRHRGRANVEGYPLTNC
jgi:hypothetical protein